METTTMVRAADWEERLSTYLDRVSEEPFKWGVHDCSLFASSAVKAQTGVDPAADFRSHYDSRQGALEALRTIGAGTLLKTATAWFGKPKHVSQAKRGDLVMRDTNALGVCVGLHSWFVGEEQGQEGLVSWPTADCSRAFTVPFDTSEAEVR